MNIIRRIGISALVLALTTVVSGSMYADVPLTCNNLGNVEEFQYSWRLRGGIRFLAGFMFPTSGVGNLRNTYSDKVHSELLITAPNGRQGGFYEYQSDIAGGSFPAEATGGDYFDYLRLADGSLGVVIGDVVRKV